MSTITEFEGGGYNIKFGGGTFEGNDHPGAVFDKKGTPHSAAGAYQIVERTAKNLMKEDQSITNFSPVNQDKMAVRIMKDSQNALNDVKGGNLNSAVAKLTGKTGLGIQWEALPGGNSKSKSMDQLRNSFKKNISNELNNKSKLATPQGELKTY
jgi:muramidase (phage lysozyme)